MKDDMLEMQNSVNLETPHLLRSLIVQKFMFSFYFLTYLYFLDEKSISLFYFIILQLRVSVSQGLVCRREV